MSTTVIAIFNDGTEARAAVNRLQLAGFDRGAIDVCVRYGDAGCTDAEFAQRITPFFNALLKRSDELQRYLAAARRCGSVVSVVATSGNDAVRAAHVMDECGAIDAEERPVAGGRASGDARLPNGSTATPFGRPPLRSRIVDRPVPENLRLREERVASSSPVRGNHDPGFVEWVTKIIEQRD